ncbi:Rieske 2Fe-2S domain-containing protein [Arthrobacter sp. ZGTC131]|uniref:Rieske 2Fe-2S domain-containing protein n=1 Tax=Arthrobacter sp. ZGTC131 TaxID=2058898 RepID=UPI00215781C8|nr:Rieske 2Fe-2S domain-containing protein [Arthrobacter sp. ZGTC131]
MFAVDGTCTHPDAFLADGYVEDFWVECPFTHPRSTFALEPWMHPAKLPVRTHEVQIVDGKHHDHRIGRGPQPSARSDSRGPCLTAGPCLTEQRTRSWLLIVT